MAERHPISVAPAGMSAVERIAYLEERLAQLWDQVWWMNLPPERRDAYRAEGFTDPILQFYIDVPDASPPPPSEP